MNSKNLKLILILSDITLAFIVAIFIISCIRTFKQRDAAIAQNEKTETVIKVSKEEENAPVDDNKVKFPVLSIAEQEMTRRAIFPEYNNARMKKLIEKLKTPGANVNIAAIGGSITEGEGSHDPEWRGGYFYRFVDKITAIYPESNVNLINAGICGTPSSLGCMRYTRDVADKVPEDGTLDMLIVEFAVNDINDVTSERGYEGIIYRALNDFPNCAVVLMFSVNRTGANVEEALAPIGNNYDLPMISMKSALGNAFDGIEAAETYDVMSMAQPDNGTDGGSKTPVLMSVEDYFFDNLHPADKGHELMANCLIRLFSDVESAEADEAADNLVIYDTAAFADMILVDAATSSDPASDRYDPNVEIEKGSFSATDDAVQLVHRLNDAGDIYTIKSFDNAFKKEEAENNAMILKFKNCSKVLLSYKNSNSEEYGKADIYIKDINAENVEFVYFATVSGYSEGIENYNRTVLLVDSDWNSDFEVKIVMNNETPDKKFTIHAFAHNGKTIVTPADSNTDSQPDVSDNSGETQQ